MDENQNFNNNVTDPNNPYNSPQDPNLNMNNGMYQDPTGMGADPNMMNQGMYQDPNGMGADPNMMNQGMYQDPNGMGYNPNMMGQDMYQDPNMMQGMYQDPNSMGFDPNMMGPNPNSLNQNMQLDPSDPNSVINAPVPPAEGPAQTNANFNTDEANFSSPKPKSNKKTFLIIGIVLAVIVLLLIVLIATGIINIGGSEPQNVTENKIVTPVNATPAPPTPKNEQLNFWEDYYFVYDNNTWNVDNTTSDTSGNQIVQLTDGTHTLKYDFPAKPISELFAQAGVDVSTAQGLKVLYETCISTSQQNSVGQLGTLTALESGTFQLTNSSPKLYYAFADLADSSSTTAGDLAQNSTTGSGSTTVTRFYFIYLSAPTDDVVFFFELKNLDTNSEPEVHQSVLKMLSSITKNASPVNTNTVANDLNEAAAANAILENQVAADNAIPNQNANQGQAADPNQQVQQQQEQQQQAQQQAQPVAQ